MSVELTRGECVKNLFGSTHRLDIWSEVVRFAIEPPERFFAKQIADNVFQSVPPSNVNAEMRRLQDLGMITPTGENDYHESQTHGLPPVWYVRTDSPLWEIVVAAIEAVGEIYPTETP